MSGKNAGKKRAAITWDDRYQQSFNELKYLCTTAPIQACANFARPFKLHTDACESGMGAILYQTHNDRTNTIISYARRNLTKDETHYPVHKLEFLTLKEAIVEKFCKYLYGSTFDIHTDNNPLMYVLTTAKLDTMSHHWVASLANCNFQLYYRVGKANMQMPCWGCPGPCVCPTPQAPNTKPLQQWYKPCRRLPWGPHKSHWNIQLWPVCHGPSGGWSTDHLYHHQRLATDPAGRPHPGSGNCTDARRDLWPVSIQANWPTWALSAPLGVQPPQAEAGHPVQNRSAKRVPGGTVSVGIVTCTQEDHCGRMPSWEQPLRPWKNAQPGLKPSFLTPNGCTGKGAC